MNSRIIALSGHTLIRVFENSNLIHLLSAHMIVNRSTRLPTSWSHTAAHSDSRCHSASCNHKLLLQPPVANHDNLNLLLYVVSFVGPNLLDDGFVGGRTVCHYGLRWIRATEEKHQYNTTTVYRHKIPHTKVARSDSLFISFVLLSFVDQLHHP